ncbi:MAG: histidine kinase dimerization/phosphoacceptor domain -containing protein [Ferruginibacter sp.]
MKCRIFLLTVSLCWLAITAFGQDISRHEADSMINLLKTKKKGIERIDLLLNLARFHVFKPGEQQIDFDSAKKFIDEAALLNKSLKSPAATGYQALTESYLINEKGQKEEAKKLAEKAISILETTTNKDYLGRALYELSRHYGYADSQERSTRIKLVERAINCFEQAGTLNQNAYSMEMLADLYNINQEYEKAIQILHKTIDAYKKTGHLDIQGAYILLGESYKYLRDYPQSLLYTLKALKTAQTLGDSSMRLCQINNVLGVIYNEIDNKEIAAKYLIDGLEVAKRHKDESAIYWLSINTSVMYLWLGQPGKALSMLELIPAKIRQSEDLLTKARIAEAYLRTYTMLGQYDKARGYCDTLLYYVENNEALKVVQKPAYSMAAQYFIATKQFQRASHYLTMHTDLLKNDPFGFPNIQNEQLWYKLDSALGNFQSAFNHLHFYKTKTDSIFNVNKLRQLQVLGVEYETAIKEDSIKAKNIDINFLTQKNQLQADNLKQAGLIKNITIIGIILVLIIMGLLYRQYLHKQKNNEVITQKNELLQQIVNEKEWLLKEVHHRVKNNLQIVMSLLNSQSVYINNDAALTAIHDSQRRVYAMSLIHQKLYQSENISVIAMPEYINELVNNLQDSFNSGSRIFFELDIEPVNLDVSQAIPLGLIINESIVNAIKYAFPGEEKGFVSVGLKYSTDDHLSLTITDNGVGLHAGIGTKEPGSLGLDLIRGLAKQIGGDFTMNSNAGLQIVIVFPLINKQIYSETPVNL